MTLLRRDPPAVRAREPLALAADARALNWALARVDWRAYTHIGKLDADVVLPPAFLASLLAAFAADPSLGMTGGVITERHGDGWRRVRQPATHAPPLARLYSRPASRRAAASASGSAGTRSTRSTRACAATRRA